MTIYENMKERVKLGYYIQVKKYENGVKTYILRKDDNRSCEFGKQIAMKLIKDTGAKLQPAVGITCPLNFTPIPVKNNCVRR